MSEINIPQDPHPLNKAFVSPSPSEAKPASSLFDKDSLKTFSAPELNLSSALLGDLPQLKSPETKDSLLHYIQTIGHASLAFRQQLSASDLVDQESRQNNSQAAADQSLALIKLYEQRKEALAQLDASVKQALEELQKKLADMQNDTQQQQDLIDKINSGNADEKQKYQELTQAYDRYLANLKSIGAVDLGNGHYSIPEGAKDQYNDFTQDYQKEVDNFNSYWKERQTELTQYNSATIAYNQNLATHQKSIEDLINKYNLSDFLEGNGWKIPNQTGAQLRDLSGYQNQLMAPLPLYTVPTVVSTYPLPSYAHSIGQFGPPSIAKLEKYTPLDRQILYEELYSSFYETHITSIDQKIQTQYMFWAFLRTQRLFPSVQDSIPDPLLNTKKLALKLLPAAFIESSMPVKPSLAGASALSLQVGLSSTQLENVLGKSLLRQAFEGFKLKLKEERMDELVDQLLLLSVGLLGNQSLQALFPSLSLLAPSLDALPKDSPAFAILFAVSFANRVQEDARHGITGTALQTFLNGHANLATLTPENKAQLEAILNLGQLLMAGKMLETSLGLQGLLAHLLPTLSPALNASNLLTQAAQEGRGNLTQLQTQLESHFIQQNYAGDSAKFLAHVGVQLAAHGPLTPTSSSLNSSQTLDHPLLLDSVKASLVLSGYPLSQAHTLAHDAVERTLIEGPYYSTKQFRSALDKHLQESGVHDKSADIALQAVLIPPTESSLAFLTSSSSRSLSVNELRALVEKRSLQLLLPQLGAQLSKQVTEELAHTLFTNPNSALMKGSLSTYALPHVMKDQLRQLNIEQDQKWERTVTQTFKDTIKSMEDFYTFSLKLMDPAYLFVYSAHTGIMYKDQIKKPLDISI